MINLSMITEMSNTIKTKW